MNAKNRPSRGKAKESLSKLLAAGAGTALVASVVATPAPADAAARADAAPVLERTRELRSRLAAPPVVADADAAPMQLAWWGNWHNWGNW